MFNINVYLFCRPDKEQDTEAVQEGANSSAPVPQGSGSEELRRDEVASVWSRGLYVDQITGTEVER